MIETRRGHLYDYPKYYDLVYGSDCSAEFHFLRKCFELHALRPVKRLFEPACGTGRLLIRLARAGYDVSGLDLNPHAVEFCNARFRRHGLPPAAFVQDMTRFRLRRKVDAAYNMINSFRHVTSEQGATNHLRCVSAALARGGLYVIGIHLTPTKGKRVGREAWVARRGNLSVISTLWSMGLDRQKRQERIGMTFDVYTPTRQFRLLDEIPHRTYTASQFRTLLRRVPDLEAVGCYDFAYDTRCPVTIGPETEDLVMVLRKR